MTKNRNFILICCLTLFAWAAKGQTSTSSTVREFAQKLNTITTSVPFLSITPDARAGGMGDAGVAVSQDANSAFWNASKLAFAEKKKSFAISGAPWLRSLVSDVWLYYLSGYQKIDDRSAWSAGMRYFSLGSIQFTDNNGNPLQLFTPAEWALDGSYSRKLGDEFSVGIGLRFIYSNLAGRTVTQGGGQARPGIAGAGDLSAYWQHDGKLKEYKARYSWGATLTNVGNKITYTNSANRDFIPTMLRTGFCTKIDFDEFNTFATNLEFNKLLVPTQPIRDGLSGKVTKGMEPNVSVPQGMIQSFYDAPGGFKEEMSEINWMLGIEYWYQKQFALRAGFHHEPYNKGNRKFFTFGVGLKYNVFGIDFAYLVPIQQRNPLENTLRFTIHFDFTSSTTTNP